ncbi:MAG: helix-turn-helix transcriptional regulator [Lachnospiraceae bacterium]|nr:helix-turn-helix transcriptional regulator [Lachnospiraceae bacterium]
MDRNEKNTIKITYSPLWKQLIDRKMTKSELRNRTHIAASTFTKMNNDQMVSMDVIARICCELQCTFDEVIQIDMKKGANSNP